jgi:hypothetical protein
MDETWSLFLLKMKALISFEASVTNHSTTERYIPEERTPELQRYEDNKPRIIKRIYPNIRKWFMENLQLLKMNNDICDFSGQAFRVFSRFIKSLASMAMKYE